MASIHTLSREKRTHKVPPEYLGAPSYNSAFPFDGRGNAGKAICRTETGQVSIVLVDI